MTPDHGLPALDPSQEAALAAAAAGGVLVLGAPGTGKTRVAVEVLVRRLLAGAPGERHVLLAPTRQAAGALRSLVTEILAAAGRGTHHGVEVLTPSAFAFGLVRARAVAHGEPVPTLLTGAQQDLLLAEILQGHAEGQGVSLDWPEGLPRESMGIPAFRSELRDLLMRADEHALSPADLIAAGRAEGRPEWVLGGQLWGEYLAVVQLGDSPASRGSRYDSSSVLAEAAWALAEGLEASVATLVVDDYQEASAGVARLLGILQSRGTRLVLTADPDVAVQTFRGAQPQLVGRAGSRGGTGGFGLPAAVLSLCHGQAPALREVTRAVTGRVATAGAVAHRQAASGGSSVSAEIAGVARGEGTPVRSVVLPSRSAEVAFVARALREAHLHQGHAWEDLAVIVRSAPLQRAFEEGLALQQVHVHRGESAMVLRDEPAVRLLLDLVDCAAHPGEDLVTGLLLTDLGGLDTVSLRRLRREVRRRIGAGEFPEGTSVGDALLELAGSVEGAGSIADVVARPAVTRVAAAMAATAAALAEPGTTHETVLWAAWQSTGLAERWRREAVERGSARADRALDAVIALFKAAEIATERSGSQAPLAFVAQIRSQSLPSDSLARTGQRPGGVAVLTPAQAAGRRWGHVFVCGVEDGAWPNTRIRDTLFGAARLADQELGRIGLGTGSDPAAARAAVLADEWRMFASAVSRARSALTVAAVSAEDTVPSAFHRAVMELTGREEAEAPAGRSRLDLRGFVGQLRAHLDDRGGAPGGVAGGAAGDATGDATAEGTVEAAARVLAILADAGEAGAAPSSWAGAAPTPDGRPYRPLDLPVTLSPSKVEVASQCPLRWVLETSGGRRAASMEASLGTLIHEIAADHPDGSLTVLREALDSRFGELGLGDGWVASRERERAEGMIRHLADYIAIRAREGVTATRVEVPVSQQVGDAVIRGSVDRVEEGPEGVRIVDLKTGKSPVSAAAATEHPQLGMYQLAVQAGALGDVASDGAGLVYVGTSNASVAQRGQDALEDGGGWARELLDSTVSVMRGSEFAAVINENCRNCPVRTSCPLQREGSRCGA